MKIRENRRVQDVQRLLQEWERFIRQEITKGNLSPIGKYNPRTQFLDLQLERGQYKWTQTIERYEVLPSMDPPWHIFFYGAESPDKEPFGVGSFVRNQMFNEALRRLALKLLAGGSLEDSDVAEVASFYKNENGADYELIDYRVYFKSLICPQPIHLLLGPHKILLRPLREDEIESVFRATPRNQYPDQLPTTVAEISGKVAVPSMGQLDVEVLQTALQLYTNRPIRYSSYEMNIVPFGSSGTMFSGPQLDTFHFFEISQSDAENVQRLVSFVFEKMPNGFGPSSKNQQPLHIALIHFKEALFARVAAKEFRMAASIFGLECLLTSGEAELSYKLALRSAILLESLGFDPRTVRDTVSKGYDFRSRFVHGESVPDAKWNRLQESHGGPNKMEEMLREYLRSCILGLAATPDSNKKRLVDEIDNAILETKARERLKADLIARVPNEFWVPPND